MTNKLISFDIFDTAILRSVYKPTDIFKIIEKDVGNDFYTKRIEAEKKAREEKPFYSLSDIYRHLPEFKEDTELYFEYKCCFANPSILKEYNKAIERGYKCIFISDMYLSSEVLKTILEKVGYNNPKVYVSCEINACKSGGGLFERVQEIEGKITKHYGDNYIADIEGAKLAGIKDVVFEPALHNKELNLPIIQNPFLKKYLAVVSSNPNLKPIDKLAWFIAPVICSFTKWVLDQRKEGQKIFFLSRDMKLPYQITKDIFKQKDVYYLYASRRSLSGISLQSNNKQLIKHLSIIYDEKEIRQLKQEDNKEAIKYLKQFNIKDNDIIVDIGYAGTIQAAINEALDVKTQGLYMQTNELIDGLQTRQYLERCVLQYFLMIEFPFGSDEDCIEGYKDGQVIFSAENPKRKELAQHIHNEIWKSFEMFETELLVKDVVVRDIEQILIHLQYYCDDKMINLYNEKIFSNRELNESIVNYDKEEILKGNLRQLYNRSYCQHLFKKLLEQDNDLKHLTKLLS